MISFIKWLRGKLIWFLIVIQYSISAFFLWAAFNFESVELKIAVSALAIAFVSIASADLKGMRDLKKMDKILAKLDEIQKTLEARS